MTSGWLGDSRPRSTMMPLAEISIGPLLGQLFEVSETFAMETQPQLLLLQKTMVVAEGVGRALNPDLNMWQLAQPLIESWIADNEIEVVHWDNCYQHEEIARLRASGVKTVGRFVWEMFSPEDAEAWEKILPAFEAENPGIDVRFEPTLNTEYDAQISAALATHSLTMSMLRRSSARCQPGLNCR